MPQHLFITGFLRSGTTLVDKLINSHQDALIASQPLFYAYVGMKAHFLEAQGLAARPYPLGNLFLESEYRPLEFTAFLDSTDVQSTWMEEALVHCPENEKPRSVKWHPGNEGEDPTPFCEGVARTLNHWADELHPTPLQLIGSKEVLCEEFIRAFLTQGTKTILVLRDPRAIVASIKCGKGHEYVNPRLTILYILRQWRKNVALALAYRNHPGFLTIRYEDMVGNPEPTLASIFKWLGLPTIATPATEIPLQDQSGEAWESNSSFETYAGISKRSVDRYKEFLAPDWIRYIETVCFPEMAVTGYSTSSGTDLDPSFIHQFEEPAKTEDPASSSLESASQSNCRREEAKRLEFLQSGIPNHEIDRWFLFEKAYSALRSGECLFQP